MDTKKTREADVEEFVEHEWAPLRHAGANELGDKLREVLTDLGETNGVVDDLKAELDAERAKSERLQRRVDSQFCRAVEAEAERDALAARVDVLTGAMQRVLGRFDTYRTAVADRLNAESKTCTDKAERWRSLGTTSSAPEILDIEAEAFHRASILATMSVDDNTAEFDAILADATPATSTLVDVSSEVFREWWMENDRGDITPNGFEFEAALDNLFKRAKGGAE